VSGTQINIQHASMRGKRRPPYGFSSAPASIEQLETLERIAVETFASMVNNGNTFQAALAAVYVSGMMHSLEASRD
jgi:hypothetical protein